MTNNIGRPKGIKPGLKRPRRITIQATDKERDLIKNNARKRNVSITEYFIQLIQESEQKEIK